jgi:hypothetical protein
MNYLLLNNVDFTYNKYITIESDIYWEVRARGPVKFPPSFGGAYSTHLHG